MRPEEQSNDRSRGVLVAVLLLLFSTGWGANHFAAMLPLLASADHLSTRTLNGAFGIYALGLMPGLILGGGLSDRIGRRLVVLSGAGIAGFGNLLMAADHGELGIYVGRLVVGAGAGLTFAAGTAWATDLAGMSGAVVAGVVLSSGFALGPLLSALVAACTSHPLVVPFAVTGVLSLLVAAGAAVISGMASPPADVAKCAAEPVEHHGQATALSFALPMAVWVFASVTVAVVTLPQHLPERYQGPLLPGMAAALSLGTGVVVQLVGRRFGQGRPREGCVGAGLAAIGFCCATVAVASGSIIAFVLTATVLGAAYGLCLRDGLIDVETMAPSAGRGTTTGIFYVFAYLGFGLPALLAGLENTTGITIPLIVLAITAVVAALHRAVRHPRRAHAMSAGP